MYSEEEMDRIALQGKQYRDAAFFEEVQRVNAAIKNGVRVYYQPMRFKGERKRTYRVKCIEWEREQDQTHSYWFVCRGHDFRCTYYDDQWEDMLLQAGVTPHPDLARYRDEEYGKKL